MMKLQGQFVLDLIMFETSIIATMHCRGIEEEHLNLKSDKDRNPELKGIWKVPAVWEQGTELKQHIVTMMHFVFLGVVKATTFMIQQYIKIYLLCKQLV